MSDEKDFIDFIEEMPGLERYAFRMYERIDNTAVKAGLQLAPQEDWQRQEFIEALRKSASAPCLSEMLRGQKSRMADALERDPTGRLAAIPSLRAWAARYDIDSHWISWYCALVNAWIDAQKASAAKLVPMMATGAAIEEAVT